MLDRAVTYQFVVPGSKFAELELGKATYRANEESNGDGLLCSCHYCDGSLTVWSESAR